VASSRKHWGTARPSLVEVIKPREGIMAPAIRLPTDQIDPDPRNPRRRLEVAELAESISTYGLLQPVVVREDGTRYRLIAGHRRFEAVRLLAGRHPDDPRWREIEAVLRRADDEEAYLLTLTENLQREDLHPKEEAAALEILVRERGWSVRKVADAIKRDPMYVSRRLRVFDDPALATPVLENRLAVSTAEVLLRAVPEDRAELVARAVAEGWGQADARRALRSAGCRVTLHPDRAAKLLDHLRQARALLEAGSATDLPAEVCQELRALSLYLTG
jgi:ParB family chromosome partitioning protein